MKPMANFPPVCQLQHLPPVSTTLAANLPPVPLVLLIPVAHLPLVSPTPLANNGNNIRLLTPSSELVGKHLSLC
jgi:hypothetical protein